MSWTPNCSVSTYLLSFQKQKDKNDTTEWKKKEYVPKKMADGAVWTGGGGRVSGRRVPFRRAKLNDSSKWKNKENKSTNQQADGTTSLDLRNKKKEK